MYILPELDTKVAPGKLTLLIATLSLTPAVIVIEED